MVCPQKELPEEDYGRMVNETAFAGLTAENPFVRDVQGELSGWKNDRSHKVLQLEGARQIGKTAELKKFACSNYYTILVDLSDEKLRSLFLDVVDNGCSPLGMEKYCRKAQLPHFKNNGGKVLIIDEIQISSKIYNSIRKLHDELACDIIVAGDYPGRLAALYDCYIKIGGYPEVVKRFKEQKTFRNVTLS